MLFGIRFDFRNPPIAGTSMADRYAAALDMAEWADGLGCVSIGVAEHHGSADGYLPSPAVMLGAMAARTKQAPLGIGALIAPFHDPLRIAEDLCVLDHLSRGRLSVIVGAGYAPHEFEMFDVELRERPQRVVELVTTLRNAFTGEPFEYHGRTVQITPPPFQPGGPKIALGGSSEGAARRAARIGDGFVPSTGEVWEFYADECVKLGKDHPGEWPGGDTRVIVLAEDPERQWERQGAFFLHETNAYGEWQAQTDNLSTGFTTVSDVDTLRATGQYRILTPDEFIAEMQALPFPFVMFHPLVGGTPPDMAWESLKLFEHEVLPAFG
jgi:alkanesulfonate monooxygenase SsuD/methylene tetrahydromethanopterin reductase-like flavin-dependent oxidoreductase (luciferase family)